MTVTSHSPSGLQTLELMHGHVREVTAGVRARRPPPGSGALTCWQEEQRLATRGTHWGR